MKCRMERLVKMKTEDELMLGFTKRKKQIDEKRKARNKFIAIISATLVFVMLTSAVALTVSAHRKTDVAIISGIGAEHTSDVTTTEHAERDMFENNENGSKPTADYRDVEIICTLPDDDPVSVSTDLYGSRSWLTDNVRNEYGLQDYDEYKTLPMNKLHAFYGRVEHGDIHEFEIRVKITEEMQSIMIYIESDDAEIMTGNVMKSNVSADAATGSDGYTTFSVKYRYKDGCTLADMRYVLFTSAERIPEAEKFIAEGNNVFIKGFDYTVNSDLRGWLMYGIQSVFTVKDTDFICVNPLYLQYMYETVASYFGDVDENGVPLLITDTEMSDYKESPWCVQKRGAQNNPSEN